LSPEKLGGSAYIWFITSHKKYSNMNPNIPIQNIMTTNLVTIRPNDPLKRVHQIFSEHDFHHLPVVGDNGNLLGIISRYDFNKVEYILSMENDKSHQDALSKFNNLGAIDIMTKYPLHLDPEDNIGLAADIFLANKFHALPIVEDGRLTGIVTSHDLLAFSFNSPVEESKALEYDED
jgi:CBS domain-containing protein